MFASIFFFIILFSLFLIMIGGSLLRGILNLLFGHRMSRQPHAAQGEYGQSSSQAQQQASSASGGKKRDKIFDDSEGEYVDFEEIKE